MSTDAGGVGGAVRIYGPGDTVPEPDRTCTCEVCGKREVGVPVEFGYNAWCNVPPGWRGGGYLPEVCPDYFDVVATHERAMAEWSHRLLRLEQEAVERVRVENPRPVPAWWRKG